MACKKVIISDLRQQTRLPAKVTKKIETQRFLASLQFVCFQLKPKASFHNLGGTGRAVGVGGNDDGHAFGLGQERINLRPDSQSIKSQNGQHEKRKQFFHKQNSIEC